MLSVPKYIAPNEWILVYNEPEVMWKDTVVA